MMRTVSCSLITASVLALAFLGCNTILDNQAGTLAPSDEAGPPPPEPTPATDANTQPDVTPDAGKADVAVIPPPGCPAGQHICNGVCVSLTDPVYGCGAPSCAPCPSTHSTMGCAVNKCVVKTCDPGYADCNANPADGCETDLSKPVTCGTCNSVCAAANPLCAPVAGTFQCTNGCTPANPVNCGNECVDPQTSTNHCGGCNTMCPVVTNATEQCALGVCGFTCKPSFHACAGKCPATTDPMACGPDCLVCPTPAGGAATCVNDVCGFTCAAPSHACGAKCVTNDPTACGATCKACTIPANANATCAAEACGFACKAGFGDCNANAADGCESTLATDPLNCGMCNKPCAVGKPCVGGVCQP